MQDAVVRFACSFSLGLAITACAAAQPIGVAPLGGSSATAPGGPSPLPTASPSAGSDAPPPQEDSGIVTPGTDSVVVRVRAGSTPPNPDGRVCAYNALYTLSLKTHELSWDFCFSSEKGKRTLQPDEVATLDAALSRLRVVQSSNLCPLHASTVSIATTGDGAREYHADLCGGPPPALGVEATDGLLKALYKLTGN